jgi:hypothetical protein
MPGCPVLDDAPGILARTWHLAAISEDELLANGEALRLSEAWDNADDAERLTFAQLSDTMLHGVVVDLRRTIQRGRHVLRLDYLRERIPRELQWQVFSDGHFTCVNCGRGGGVPLTIDHIFPISKGGSNRPYNLQAMCGPCNSRKRDTCSPVEADIASSQDIPR